MKNKYICLFVIAVALMHSCIIKKKSLKEVLENNCFWDYWNSKETIVPARGYKFKSKGECQQFEYNFVNGRKTDTVYMYPEGDQILPKTWEIEGDSILIAQGWAMRIQKYNEDTIWLKNFYSGDSSFLTKNCKTVSKSKYW